MRNTTRLAVLFVFFVIGEGWAEGQTDERSVLRPSPSRVYGLEGSPSIVVDSWSRLLVSNSAINEARYLDDGLIVDCLRFDDLEPLGELLRENSRVRWLRVTSTQNQTDLAWLKHVKQLRGLSLRNLSIKAEGIDNLNQLTGIQWLDLRGCRLPESVKGNVRLPNVKVLLLGNTNATDVFLDKLQLHDGIRTLDLATCDVDSRFLTRISKESRELLFLNLMGCRGLKDDDWIPVSKISGLRHLVIIDTLLTKRLDSLTRSLPKCFISAFD